MNLLGQLFSSYCFSRIAYASLPPRLTYRFYKFSFVDISHMPHFDPSLVAKNAREAEKAKKAQQEKKKRKQQQREEERRKEKRRQRQILGCMYGLDLKSDTVAGLRGPTREKSAQLNSHANLKSSTLPPAPSGTFVAPCSLIRVLVIALKPKQTKGKRVSSGSMSGGAEDSSHSSSSNPREKKGDKASSFTVCSLGFLY